MGWPNDYFNVESSTRQVSELEAEIDGGKRIQIILLAVVFWISDAALP